MSYSILATLSVYEQIANGQMNFGEFEAWVRAQRDEARYGQQELDNEVEEIKS